MYHTTRDSEEQTCMEADMEGINQYRTPLIRHPANEVICLTQRHAMDRGVIKRWE
jgi:hypothetical protein